MTDRLSSPSDDGLQQAARFCCAHYRCAPLPRCGAVHPSDYTLAESAPARRDGKMVKGIPARLPRRSNSVPQLLADIGPPRSPVNTDGDVSS
jgi:hypothetical protein